MTLAIFTTGQALVALGGGAVLCVLWFAAERYERWRGRTWRVEDDDGYVITSLWEYRKDRE